MLDAQSTLARPTNAPGQNGDAFMGDVTEDGAPITIGYDGMGPRAHRAYPLA